MRTSKATAAPVHVTIDGKEMLLSPLRDEEWGIYEEWLRQEYLDFYREQTKREDPELRASLMQHAYDEAALISITHPRAVQQMTTLAGATELIWLALSIRQPKITRLEVRKALLDEKTFELLFDKFDDVNALEDRPPKAKAVKRTARKRAKAKRKSSTKRKSTTGSQRTSAGGRKSLRK